VSIIDSQIGKAAQKGSRFDPQSNDSGMKVLGRKRHILVDTLAVFLSVAIHSANINKRSAARLSTDHRKIGNHGRWRAITRGIRL
jgi:hypothetical protein